ncbi:MAG: iron complex outermembrane receptor protein [Oceanospirillaceae bacterium]|jgi:iron complex outermembrane receptor protein
MKLNIRRQTSAPITIGRCQVSTKESLFTLRSPFFIALTLLLTVNGFLLTAQTPDSLKINRLNEVVVKATRATNKTGMAFTNLYKQEIQKQNLGQDIPFLLNQTPSVVVNSDAGAGIGYTGIRIRGTDATRINVTLNGVPYNDSESQGVFWVNLPDFSSSVQSMQIQRGVGTSTNGAGAFGATINVNTLGFEREPYGETNVSVGSFNTLKTNVLASTGLINNHFVVDARLSRITSDGFIDRSASNLKSFYVSGGYYGDKSFVRFNVFSGQEVTQQAWEGVPQSVATGDLAGVNAYVNRNFLGEEYKQNLLDRGRKFNPYNYDNQVDNYQQDHYQLISSFQLSDKWRFNPTLHYTYGRGYFEQFREGNKFSDYGLPNVEIGNETITRTDLVRRKWLDNHFYGAVWSLDYTGTGKLNANIGGGVSRYEGDHYGEIIWSQFAPNNEVRPRWYENLGTKDDFNIYGKAFYQFTQSFNTYLDLQYRTVDLRANGVLDNLERVDYGKRFNFFNPKVGVNYVVNESSSMYASYAVGNKEPSRQDLVDNAPNLPNAENLQDVEIGYRMNSSTFNATANFYYMYYRDQLVLSGDVNGVGEAVRVNVPNSYRAGIELQADWRFADKWLLAANATFSRNKVQEFTETILASDDTPNQVTTFTDTDISFSPSVVAGSQLSFMPVRGLELTWLSKYVSDQYLDNTSDENRKLDAFFVNDLRLGYTLKPKFMKEINFSLLVNNIFNQEYEPNGYTYSYIFGDVITENFVYPQAGTNFLAAVRLRF